MNAYAINKRLIALTFTYLFIFLPLILQSQREGYRVINSLIEWAEEVNNWPDSLYYQENLWINVDFDKDKDYVIGNWEELNRRPDTSEKALVFEKPIEVHHIVFSPNFRTRNDYYRGANLKNLVFNEEVMIYHSKNGRLSFQNTLFKKYVQIRRSENQWWFAFKYCNFEEFVNINNPYTSTPFQFEHNVFQNAMAINSEEHAPSVKIKNCDFKRSLILAGAGFSNFEFLSIDSSKFQNGISIANAAFASSVSITRSELNYIDIMGSSLPSFNTYIPFDLITEKFSKNLIGHERLFGNEFRSKEIVSSKSDSLSQMDYDALVSCYSQMLSIYQNRSEYKSYNSCYVEMKNLLTERLRQEYIQNPNFNTYFDFQVNRFLKVFSDYGTRPAKALIFSIYVISFFAFIYLLFPNSWDSQGKKRVINRFSFFLKYMNRQAGIHEVYLDENQRDFIDYEDFRKLVVDSNDKVPKFFTATAMPIYKWSVAGTRLSARLLKNVDIMKGTWKDLPKSKRVWKTGLLIGAFSIAVIYDLFIKALNALMLSINTFTTLGFGEIPIKGLPRYLAIIQGFIGWFMLTIFSVSLISQLLN